MSADKRGPAVSVPKEAGPAPGAVPDEAELEREFRTLVAEWKPAVEIESSATRMAMHPAYQRIIGMGPKVVPLLLSELDREPDHWFWALRAVTGEDPIPSGLRGNLRKMREAWLAWGKAKGYRSLGRKGSSQSCRIVKGHLALQRNFSCAERPL